MKIAIVGSPSCRKSTTAEGVNIKLKQDMYNSVFCPEVARNYIGRYGQIREPWEQLLICQDQIRVEKELSSIHDIVVCDASAWLGYVYCSFLMPKKITEKLYKLKSELHTMVIKHASTYDLTVFMPVQEPVVNDGVREQNDKERELLQDMIKGFMKLEGVAYETVSGSVPDKINAVYDMIVTNFKKRTYQQVYKN